ncbi:MAG: hypothetical protein QNI92_16810 [Desulfobacterales bacterium]|nr:hypothetical protein [Desulfobacterales bacterium]
MELRPFKTSDIKISPVSEGMWQADKVMCTGNKDTQTIETWRAAFEAGITGFNTTPE